MERISEIPKEAKLIPGYDNYFCTPNGDIISIQYGEIRLRKKHINEKGYHRVCLSKNNKFKSLLVHRIVAELFIGPSELYVNHKDLNKQNNNVNNLEYVTNRENICHFSILKNKTPGVTWDKKRKKWVVQVFIGLFEDKDMAINACLDALQKLKIENKYKTA